MRRTPAWVVLATLVVCSSAIRAWVGLRIPTPWIAADEMIYAELGRSLWETGRLTILGQDTAFYSLVHPALIGLPLAMFDTALGYDLARVLQAIVMSLTAVPVYVWGRRLMSEPWALVAAALTLAIPGLAYAGLLMTETVFVPVVVLAAWAAARVLVTPTLGAQAVLVGVVILAILTRLQGIVLVPSFVLAAVIFAALTRSRATVVRVWPALAALALIAGVIAVGGLGAYEAAGTRRYDIADAIRYAVYHAADTLLIVGILPACAAAMLVVRRDHTRETAAFLAVMLAIWIGVVAQVGVFASGYVGRLAERDLLAVAPLLFLALCLWLDRGAPRTRFAAYAIALGASALVLALPLGRLVHKAALPDALSLVPVWELGEYETVVWTVMGVAVVAFALLPPRALVAAPVVLAAMLIASSVAASRFIEAQATQLRVAFFGTAAPDWVDDEARGPVAYFYDGEPHWNAVWSYAFWNRKVRRVFVLAGAPKIPGPLPQTRVDPEPLGELGASPRYVVAPTPFTFDGSALASVDQVGLVHRGLVLWRVKRPLQVRTVRTGVQGSGDIVGPATMTVYDCTGGTFELTLIAKGAPVTVRLDSGVDEVERTLQPQEIWRPSVGASSSSSLCSLALTPSGIVGSTRFDYVGG